MIKSVTVTNHLGESLELELLRPDKSGLAIINIDGLGPPKADINVKELSGMDGAVFNSSRINTRNIVLQCLFMYHPSIEAARLIAYKFFPIKKKIKLTIQTDKRFVEISGIVESNEPDIFSNMSGTSISLICPSPYFYSAGPDGLTVSTFFGSAPTFSFPFSNESLHDDLIELGQIISVPEQTIYYEGDADTGVTMYLHALGAVGNITIHNTQTLESMKISSDRIVSITGSALDNGDTVIITTLKGAKSIYLLRAGVYINILNCLDRDADWFQLSKGDNVFGYDVDLGFTNLEFRIENRALYEGV